jgi:hypothetical protein
MTDKLLQIDVTRKLLRHHPSWWPMSKLTFRYSIRRECDWTWTVYDIFTGKAAEPTHWILNVPTEKEAKTYCAILNVKDMERRERLGF